MPLDPYRPCPGGTNKKIKFCGCDKEVLGDLNKIIDAMDGEQRAAALSHANRSLELHGQRACLLALKCTIQLQLRDFENLAQTTATFLEKHPDNPVALGMSAIVSAVQADTRAAVGYLQRSLQKADGKLPGAVYSALGIVARALLDDGDVLAALGHAMLQMLFGTDRDSQPVELLVAIFGSPNVPQLLKQEFALETNAPAGVPAAEYGAALELASVGRWAEACARFYNLATKHPGAPALVRNMAVLQGWLGDDEAAGESWRQYATLDGVDLDSRVEAEALAQMLVFADDDQDQVDEITHVYPVSDSERVLERFLAEKHVVSMPIDLQQMATEETPPPKAAFWLLDRVLPAVTEDLKFHDVPNILGEMYVYGKETDREARVEFVSTRTSDFDTKLQKLKDLLGEFGGTLEKEETTGQVSATSAALTWQWRLPENVSLQQRQALIEDKRRDVHLNVWPQTPLRELDGQCPAEVVSYPAYQVRLLAAILLLEMAAEQSRSLFDHNELRAKLGLPRLEDFVPADPDTLRVPPVWMHRVPAERLSDEALPAIFSRAVMFRAVRAIRRLGLELVARESLKGKVDRDRVYSLLVPVARDAEEALQFNTSGRQAAEAAGRSPAVWLLGEVEIRLLRGEMEEAFKILGRVQARHLREPGVAEALYALLTRLGLVTPDGRVAMPGAQAAAAAPARAAGESAGAPAGGQIWTPGSDAAGPPGEKKPTLWVPGMS